MATAFANYIKQLRIKKGVTLREHCTANGLDTGNYSRMERSLYPPPQKHELLEKYAQALDVEPGSDEWMELFNLAAMRLPKEDVELVEKLPVLFRTDSMSSEKLDELVEKVRRS